MAYFLTKVLAWALCGVLFVGLIVLVVWVVRGFGAMFTPRDRVKVYYDDNDHTKGYYYVGKPGGTYPIGYPKEKIIKDMEAYEQLKREQKAKSGCRSAYRSEYTQKKSRSMWLQILLMTPAEYMQYRRQRKESNKKEARLPD